LGDRSFLPLILTFFEQFSNDSLKRILRTRWTQFLSTDPTIKRVFEKEFPLIVFKRGKTIGNILTSTKFQPSSSELDRTLDILESLLVDAETNSRVTRCNRTNCKCCSSILETSTIHNAEKNLAIEINDNFTCDSSGLIYVISCLKCHKQYVGQTDRMLKERLNNHRSDIRLNKATAVGLHFNLPEHTFSDLRIIPIQDLSLLQRHEKFLVEDRWMRTLNTKHPYGINNNPLANM
jgi:hypothetical protein